MISNRPFVTLSLYSLLLVSASSFAASTTVMTDNFGVSVPRLTPGFEVHAAALWLAPGASNLNYVINNKALPVQSPSWTEQELNPGYSAAFAVGARYIFPNSGSDIRIDWTHLNTSDSKSLVAANNQYFLGPDFQIGPDGIPIRQASGNAKFRYDIINLDGGQFVNLGPYVAMRFFGGLSGGSLREQVSATYSGNVNTGSFPGPFSMSQKVSSDFYGVGPRIGMDAIYNINQMFSILGEGAISALIGRTDSKTNYTGSAVQLATTFGQAVNSQFIKDQNLNHVVPGLDAKLGVKYQQCFDHVGTVSVTAGYQAAVYMNAINQYLPGTLVTNQPMQSGGIFVMTMDHTLSNYSVQGPYLDIALQF